MAIKKIRETPSELPHARLYLDDVEDISKLLLDAYTPIFAKWKKEEAKIRYRFGDTEMDSIDDLQNHGGSTTNLDIKVEDGGRVHFGFYSKPSADLYGLDDQARWTTYANLKAIFDARQMTFKNALWGLPAWLKVVSWILVLAIPSLLPSNLYSRTALLVLIGYFVVLGLSVYAFMWPSRVYFIRSHERSKALSADRRRNVRDIILLAVGALIAELVRRWGGRFFKEVWDNANDKPKQIVAGFRKWRSSKTTNCGHVSS
jgi:hypothetical protein